VVVLADGVVGGVVPPLGVPPPLIAGMVVVVVAGEVVPPVFGCIVIDC
jgi:hypothetical protein